MIVLEGPDMIGKTTIARKLHARLPGLTTLKFGKEHSQWSPGQYKRVIQRNTVADRLHMSELVYGTVTRGGAYLTAEQYKQIDKMLFWAEGIVVVLWASDETYERLIELHHARGELYDAETCRKVNREFAKIGRMLRDTYRATYEGIPILADLQFEVRIEADGLITFADKAFIDRIVATYKDNSKL